MDEINGTFVRFSTGTASFVWIDATKVFSVTSNKRKETVISVASHTYEVEETVGALDLLNKAVRNSL